jgi:hypothetical protein
MVNGKIKLIYLYQETLSIPFAEEGTVQLNVFNIFDFESPEDYNEYGEADGAYPDPDWQATN